MYSTYEIDGDEEGEEADDIFVGEDQEVIRVVVMVMGDVVCAAENGTPPPPSRLPGHHQGVTKGRRHSRSLPQGTDSGSGSDSDPNPEGDPCTVLIS